MKKDEHGGGLDVCFIGAFVCESEEDGQMMSFDVVVKRKDDCNIPHVHIWDSETDGGKFDACVGLVQNKSFGHGYHTDILNARQLEAFKTLMDSIHENDVTKYVYAIKEWNQNNSNAIIEIPYR